MKGSIESMGRATMLLIGAAFLLSACGGGGGGGGTGTSTGGGSTTTDASQARLYVTPTTLTVSASLTDPAPTALLQVSIIASTTSGDYYIQGGNTQNGIQSLSGAVSGSVESVTVTFKDPQTLGVGTYSDTITIEGCVDQGCTTQVSGSPMTIPVTYKVTQPQSTISSISPTAVSAGAPAFTLTVNGSNFLPQSTVLWGGSARATTYVSANQLTAQITAADVAASGTVVVAVANAAGGGVDSNTVNFTIQALAPLALNSISPVQVSAGGSPFFLTVFGAGFTSSSQVAWNGSTLPTTYVSATTLRASVDASLIASTGTAAITAVNPPAEGGTSSAATLTIAAPSIDAVSYQINPEHTGAVSFNSMSFPTSSLWSVNVGGPASYALIVGGRVFVSVSISGNSELLALDASSGATLWGPIALAGNADATYDDGTLFVLSNTGISSAVISALDPATGNPKWSSTVGGGWYPGPPVAADGVVYALNGGLLSAYDETSGATLWTQSVSGTSGTVAVAVDGVYSSAPCTTYDLQPVTGAVLWTNNSGCEGGGGATPVVANGVLYSPTGSPYAGQYAGTTFDAETGAVLGSFVAAAPPAVTASTTFMLNDSTLQAISRANGQVLWSFAGDGALITAPIAVDGYVIVGSSAGNLYGLDAGTGAQVWTENVGGSMGQSNNVSGLAAGDGLLVVPAGNSVTAYLLSSSP